ncbi:MAG: hypothetical protein RL208_82 [Pseudomonadota bacterium]|jgi:transcriptional regulator GlxA family with amidase domain
MKISIVTFDSFNELDSLVAFSLFNIAINHYIKESKWSVCISSPAKNIISMNGLVIQSNETLQYACKADAVIIGSGAKTLEIVKNESIINQLQLDPKRQLIASQCSGALVLSKLGLLQNVPVVCTDLTTKPYIEELGYNVSDKPFFANQNVATAGGCLSSQYIVGWIIAKLDSIEAAKNTIYYAAPVGEKEEYAHRMVSNIKAFL